MSEPIFLVTGAAGFIGSHSVDRLLEQGYRVVGLDNLRTGNKDNLYAACRHSAFAFVEGDVRDEALLRSLLGEYPFAGVLHLAALVSVPESFEQPELNYEINLAASERLARLCLEYHCRRVVFASSSAVYGDTQRLPSRETDMPQPLSPYAAAKLASEIMLLGYARSYGLEAVCLRYFNVYGLRQDPGSPYSGVLSIFTDRYKAGLPVKVYGDGEQSRDFISVSDVSRANCHALTASRVRADRYNVCTGSAISLNRVLENYRTVFPEVAKPGYVEARLGDIRHSRGDPARLGRELGLVAQIPFDQGLRALIAGRAPEKKS